MVKAMRTYERIWLIAGYLMAATAAQVNGQGSPCLSNADTAAAHISVVTRTVTYMDSTVLASQGIPYRPPEGVTLVTDSATCQHVVDAKNARIAPGDTVAVLISKAYVLRVGTTAYAMIPENNGDLYIYFDSANYTWLAGMVANR